MSDIATAYVQIQPTAEGIQGKLSNLLGGEASSAGESAGGKFSGGFGSSLKSGLGTAAKVGAAGLAVASAAAVGFAKSSVDAGMKFDSSMSQVAATMGKTMLEMESEVGSVDLAWGKFSGNLRDYAQEMGAHTAFSATEAAEALNYMALAGYDTQTSMQMLPNVLNLAAAGGIELAYASDMVTDAQTALGLSLDETETMVDQMAKASATTNTSVSQLGEAFLTIGGNAKSVKGGTAELSAVLGALADNGIKGSEAGTHLRNILLAMNPTTDAAAAAWERLGVEAYDSEGNLRSLEDVFSDLSKAMDGMTDLEKTKLISSMFNKTDLASVNALLATTSDRWDEINVAIDGAQGSAQKMADTQLNNLAGDITLFKSALEGAQIAVSDGLAPTLRDFVQFGSDGLSRLTDAFKNGGLDEAMSVFGSILSDGLNMIINALPKIVEAGASVLTSFVKGIADNIPQIASAAVEIIQSLTKVLIDNLPLIIDAGVQAIGSLTSGIAQALPTLIPAVVDAVIAIANTLTQPNNLNMIITGGIEIIIALIDGIVQSLPRLIEAVPQIISNIVGAIVSLLPEIASAGVRLVVSLGSGLVGAIPQVVALTPQLIAAIAGGIAKGIDQIKNTGKQLIDGFTNGIKGSFNGMVQNVKRLFTSFIDSIKGVFGIHSPSTVFANIGQNLIAGLANGINNMASNLLNMIRTLANNIVNSFKNLFGIGSGRNIFTSIGENLMVGLNNGIVSKAQAVLDNLSSIASSIVSKVSGVLGIHSPSRVFYEIGNYLTEGFANGITAGEQEVENAINSMTGKVLADSISSVSTAPARVSSARRDDSWQDLSTLIDMLSTYLPMIANKQVILNGSIVGELAPGMDKELGRISYNRSREVFG